MSHAHPLPAEKTALVLSNRLGDSLYQMTIANNLRKAGRDISVYGCLLYTSPSPRDS